MALLTERNQPSIIGSEHPKEERREHPCLCKRLSRKFSVLVSACASISLSIVCVVVLSIATIQSFQVAARITMALWDGLGHVATVAQLVGADVGGLISMIMQAALTAQQNKKECEQLARRVFMIAELLPHLQDPDVMRRPEVRRPLVGLDETLQEAHELVMSCQGKSAAYRLVMAGRQAERFRDVERKIDSYLIVFPFISYIGITRRLDRIYKVLLPNDDMALPSSSTGSHSHELELAEEVAQEVVLHGEEGEKFTYAELEAATNNFSPDKLIGEGGSGTVYIASLPDGREVAIKYLDKHCNYFMEAFEAERSILSSIRHEHIIRLYGCCVERPKEETKRSLRFWKKNTVAPKLLLVLEYMKNGSLDDHLHGSWWSSSPLRTSWRMRMEILLGVSRAIEYLHTLSPRPVIHRDIKPGNILLDERWAPRLFDFGISLWGDETEGTNAAGTIGYMAPDYYSTKEISPKIDVYSFGVVMLEVLAGKRAFLMEDEVQMIFNCEDDEEEEGEEANTIAPPPALVPVALRLIEEGKLRKLLDRRPGVPEPTPRQLEAAELVVDTAVRCLWMQREERPAMSEVVANLEGAVRLVLGEAR